MNFYLRHLGDYAKDTGHLTALEHGFYTLLLDRYYTTERGIPVADVYCVTKATGQKERRIVDRVLKAFFQRNKGLWIKPRCEQEIARYREKSAKARQSAEQRWERERNANVLRTHSDGNAIQNPESRYKNSEGQNGPSPKAAELRRLIGTQAARLRVS